MTRRIVLASIAISLLGGVATPALADVLSSDSGNSDPTICILGTNHANGTRDGICVGIPIGSTT